MNKTEASAEQEHRS